MNLADLRREYTLDGLRRKDLADDPLAQFGAWFEQWRASAASRSTTTDVNAMTLATVDAEGRPAARIVLLKGVDERGFLFFTNYESDKGRQMARNPHAALTFYWPDFERQVRVEGDVTKLAAAESDAYFRSRPRGSRLAALASHQSEVVADRAALEAKWREMEEIYPGEEIPCPPFWGGYALRPARIEFWQGRANRLHDRFRYTRTVEGAWKIERLSP